MKVKELIPIITGCRRFSFSESEKPLSPADFWHKYRSKPEWEAEVDTMHLIPCRPEASGLWFDDVICLILLKDQH